MTHAKLQDLLQGKTIAAVREGFDGEVIIVLTNGTEVKFTGLYSSDTVKVLYREPTDWKAN